LSENGNLGAIQGVFNKEWTCITWSSGIKPKEELPGMLMGGEPDNISIGGSVLEAWIDINGIYFQFSCLLISGYIH